MNASTPHDYLAALRQAIESLYEVFSQYRLRPHVEGCPCCFTDADHRQLHQRPLQQLTRDNLLKFALSALYTWGTLDDFRHFLPRLLDFAAELDHPWEVDAEILLSKLAYGEWQRWPEGEQLALRAFFMARWQATLAASAVDSGQVEDWLCAIAQAENDLTAYLAAWATNPAPRAREHLAVLLADEGNRILTHGKLGNTFWEGRRAQMRQVLHWLGTPVVGQLLEAAFFSAGSSPLAEQFSQALTVHEGLAAHLALHHKDTP